MFKKTLPGSASSLLQLSLRTAEMKKRALLMIREAEKNVKPAHRHLDFIALALNGKKIGLDKVIKMCDDLVATLTKEQEDDDAKKAYCEKELDATEDNKKVLEQAISDSTKAIEDAEETMATSADEIKALEKGIKDLDKSVDEATEQRKEENAEYKTLMASNGAAKELIGMAKNRLNKFYNPKLYKAPPKRELTEEERIAVNMGETLAPTPAPGGIAGTGVTVLAEVNVHGKADPGPAPEQASYGKKTEESNGVITMMDMLIKDLEKEMQIGETAEKDAQADYESAMSDAATKRADDSKTLGDKEAAKADTEGALQGHKDSKTSHTTELMGVDKYISSLHGECDWLLQYFDTRKEARTSEIEALGKAKDVLNGADYALVQTRAVRSLRGSA